MNRRLMLAVVTGLLTIIPVSAGERMFGQPLDVRGPCYLTDRPNFELFARGTCRCPNGRCVVVSCRAEVGASIEVAKGELRARLEAQARLKAYQAWCRNRLRIFLPEPEPAE